MDVTRATPRWALWTGVSLMLLGLLAVTAAGMMLLMLVLSQWRDSFQVYMYVSVGGLAVGVAAFVVGWALTQVKR